ncbi:YchJ family protein [Winslowiella toletana]|nr:YchJ family protein [Winslowiella toletana]
MTEKCPCCSGMQYSLCCEPWLNGSGFPPSAEKLMRSRYTAYVKQDAAYLIATWHSSVRHPQLQSVLEESFANTRWLGLNITAQQAGKDDDEAFVTFFARFAENQRTSAIHERSRFLRDDQRWYYIDGIAPQVGRNDRCPCGSEKKYKKCCGQ